MTRRFPFLVSRPGIGVLVVCLGTLMVPLDTSVNVAFPHIISAFGLPVPAVQWVVITYTLTYAALMLVFGRVGDILGYRRIFLLGAGWSAAAFVLCALAPSFGWLLAARVLQGVGAALTLSCGPALATSLYPEVQRTRVLGLYAMVFGVGGVLGPLLAGLLVQRWGWPSVFGFRVPIALAVFALRWGLPAEARPASRETFDAAGALLLVSAVSTLLLALNELQHLDDSAWRLAIFGGAALLSGAGFVVQERRVTRPIINLRSFRNVDFALLNLAHTLLNLAGFAVLLLVPFYLDRAKGLSIPAVGAVLSASPFGAMLAAPLAGRLAPRVHPRPLALAGAAAMAVGLVFISCAGAQADVQLLAGWMFMQGFGLGLFQVAYFDVATATIPLQDRGVAGSLVMMTRTVGVVMGATVLMLAFEGFRATAARHGAGDADAFLAGFQGAFRIAAAIPILVVAFGLLRGWARMGGQSRSAT